MTRSPRSACSQLLLSVLLLSAGGSGAAAQVHADTAQVLVDLITVEDGLPQGMVQCMAQDRSGYLWFGTRGGLARSDGYAFTIFQHDADDSTSIASNIIRSMVEDDEGYLWLGMESGALDRFDPRTERFQHIIPDPGTALGQWPEIRKLVRDPSGWIWIHAFDGGLRVVRKGARGQEPVIERAQQAFHSIRWPAHINALELASDGALWLNHGDSILVVDVHRQRDAVRARPACLPESMGSLTANGRRFARDVRAGGMWLCDASGVYRFAFNDGSIKGHLVPGFMDPVSVHSVGNAIWVTCTLANSRLDPVLERSEFIRFVDIHGKRVKPEMEVISCLVDRAGNAWAGTNGYGVLKLTPMTQRFHHLPDVATIFPISSTALALAKPGIDAVTDGSGGIHSGNVYRALAAHGLKPYPYLWAADADGSCWVSAASEWRARPRLAVVDAQGQVTFPSELFASFGVRGVYPGAGDHVWAVATRDTLNWNKVTHLLCIDTRRRALVRAYDFPWRDNIWSDINSFAVAQDGAVWVSLGQGVHRLDTTSGEWEHHGYEAGQANSFPKDGPIGFSFAREDPDHVLWIGTSHSGLLKYDRRKGVLARFTSKEGLPSNKVYGILPDERGNLWFSTDMGLCRLDPRTNDVKRYTYEDGLLGNEFNTRATGRTADGRMFFGGPMGTTWFRPSEFYGPVHPAPTVLTGLRLADRPVAIGALARPGDDEPLLTTALRFMSSITVPYDERMLTFSFACMDHTAPEDNTFRYRLVGFGNNWIQGGAAHEATFTNLDPGAYTFEVQGCTKEGEWDTTGAHVQVIITPPWWGTWWFRISAVLAFAGVLYSFYRYRLAQAVKVVRVRERIARDLHDEIGSTLSSVSLFSSVAQKKAAGKAPEASELLGRITESTTQVLEAMNDIVWAVNAENDNMASVIKRMHAFAVNVTEARGCKLHLRADEELKHERLEMTQRKNLYLIFKEAVNNAVKYSCCANLRVELVCDKSAVLLRVADDGKGFDPSMLNESAGGGNGLGNMRNRAAEIPGTLTITSALGKGTTVELHFVPGTKKRSLESMTSRGEASR